AGVVVKHVVGVPLALALSEITVADQVSVGGGVSRAAGQAGQRQGGLVLEVDVIELDAVQTIAGQVPDGEHGVLPGGGSGRLEGVGGQGGAGGQGEVALEIVAPVAVVQDEHDGLGGAAGVAQVDGEGD